MPTPLDQIRSAPPADRPRPWRCEWSDVDAGRALRLSVRGELDVVTAPALDRSLRLARAIADLVILDLRGLDFIDGSGIKAILLADRRARAHGNHLAVVRGPAELELFLRVTGSEPGLWLVDRPSAAVLGPTHLRALPQ